MARRKGVRKYKHKETEAVLPNSKAVNCAPESDKCKDIIIGVLALVTALLAGAIIGHCICRCERSK